MSGSDIGRSGFIGHVEVLFGGFAADVHIDAAVDGGVHHVLSPASAPRHSSDLLAGITQGQGGAAQRGANALSKVFERTRFAGSPPDQVAGTKRDGLA